MKKSFSQHLLTDKNYLRKIVENIELKSDDIVLEIGAGTGLLTLLLAEKAKKVFAVEIERDILKKLKVNIQSQNLNNVEIIESDFLKLDLNKLINYPFKVVGNIPYNITSKILIKLFGEIDKPAPHLKSLKRVYLMLQLEVAKRLVAKVSTKAYSPLSLLVQYFSEPEILFKVPASVFFPKPKVDSAFVCFNLRQEFPTIKNPALLKSLIRTAFQQRRKKLINSLSKSKLCTDKTKLVNVFNDLKMDQNLRAENLDFKKYLEISNRL